MTNNNETAEQAAERIYPSYPDVNVMANENMKRNAFIVGTNWQKEIDSTNVQLKDALKDSTKLLEYISTIVPYGEVKEAIKNCILINNEAINR